MLADSDRVFLADVSVGSEGSFPVALVECSLSGPGLLETLNAVLPEKK